MKQIKTRLIRKTVDIDPFLSKQIQDMADSKNWSFSYMSYVLLLLAVKEKLRKSKIAVKEDHS